LASDPSCVDITGGTHVAGAPCLDFWQRVFIPVLEQLGPSLRLGLHRPGFYPSGGGEIQARIQPASNWASWEMSDSGRALKNSAVVLLAHGSKKTAERQLDQVQKKLRWSEQECRIEFAKDAQGPGNVVMLETIKENISALFCGYSGAYDTPQNAVLSAIDSLRRFVAQRVPVCPMLADEIILPLSLAKGGEFRTTPLSGRALREIELIRRFLDIDISLRHSSRSDTTVCIQC